MIDAGKTILTVDQHHKPVATTLRRGWFRSGSQATVDVVRSRDSVTVLGAVSHEKETFYYWSEERLTAQHGIAYLRSLIDEFGENIVVLLDRAPYFYAKDVWGFVSGERSTEFVGGTSIERVVGEELEIWYFPPHAPDLNPVVECWNQLEA